MARRHTGEASWRMRVLFVDDEPRVLDALRRLLRQRRDEWEMGFVTSGAEALERLSAEPVDIVISDMRMPGMDGAELLTRVRSEHPSVVRMVLSGHSEQEASMRVLQVAHQYLSKPCDSRMLTDAIQRASTLRHTLGSERVR